MSYTKQAEEQTNTGYNSTGNKVQGIPEVVERAHAVAMSLGAAERRKFARFPPSPVTVAALRAVADKLERDIASGVTPESMGYDAGEQ